jgi:hypothetical protein
VRLMGSADLNEQRIFPRAGTCQAR